MRVLSCRMVCCLLDTPSQIMNDSGKSSVFIYSSVHVIHGQKTGDG